MGVAANKPELCMAAKIPGFAGPANFQRRLAEGLIKRDWDISYGLTGIKCSAVLVIGGSREFTKLRRIRKMGVPIVQRLNGMNWIHRQKRTGLKHFVRSELNNLILRIVRDRFADWIVYQSDFAQQWWRDEFGSAEAGESVIHNGVPLDLYSPEVEGDRTPDRLRLLMVEGNLSGGYEVGLENGIQLANELSLRNDRGIELVVVGHVPEALKRKYGTEGAVQIRWAGMVPSEQVLSYYRSAQLMYAGDPNPACPNAVIEALACGLPVIAFDTGAIPEIIKNYAGQVVPYDGDVWRLDRPNIEGLAVAAENIIQRQSEFMLGARRRAVEAFDVEDMVNRYASVLDSVRR